MSEAIVAIGASAGGIDALQRVVAGLPAALPAAVCVVLHMPPEHDTRLPDILSRCGALPASLARDDEPLIAGHIYVAPPSRHLIVDTSGRMRLTDEAQENNYRPSIDVLFRSAAHAVHERAVGVILSGMLDDGASGLRSIERHGGIALVQDPHDAVFSDMPRSAINATESAVVLPASQIGGRIAGFVAAPRGAVVRPLRPHQQQLTDLGCPACGGVLKESDDGVALHYNCRVGHSFSPESLFELQGQEYERGMWMAIRTLDEQAAVYQRLLTRSGVAGNVVLRKRFERRSELARSRSAAIRAVLFDTVKLRGELVETESELGMLDTDVADNPAVDDAGGGGEFDSRESREM